MKLFIKLVFYTAFSVMLANLLADSYHNLYGIAMFSMLACVSYEGLKGEKVHE